MPLASPTSNVDVLGSIRRFYDSAYESWDESDLRGWLGDHGIIAPQVQDRDTLLSVVRDHWNTARSYAAAATDLPQTAFGATTDAVYSTWSDSQLRDFLLQHGVISPSSKREELLLLAKQQGRHAQGAYHTATSVVGQATDSVSSGASVASSAVSSAASAATSAVVDTASAAFYTAIDAPSLAYDFVAEQLSDGKDFVYSTWDDNRLRSYAEEHGIIKPAEQVRREQLLERIRRPYAEAASATYETWSDSYLVRPPLPYPAPSCTDGTTAQLASQARRRQGQDGQGPFRATRPRLQELLRSQGHQYVSLSCD